MPKKQHKNTKSAKPVRPLPRAIWWKRVLHDTQFRRALILVGVWRSLLEVLNQLVGYLGHHTSFVTNLAQWAHWDGTWYMSIITLGYRGTHEFTANVAFFPGFPVTIDAISTVLHLKPLYVGLVLNIFVTVFIVYLLMKLAQFFANRYGGGEKQNTIALLTGISFLTYYSSFFLAAFYADAILVLGFVGAVYFAYTKRIWLTVPFTVMASISKITGAIAVVLVGLIILEEWIRAHDTFWKLIGRWFTCIAGFAGLASYVVYLNERFRQPLLFYTAEETWGRNHEGFFLTNIYNGYYKYLLDHCHFHDLFTYLLSASIMILPFVALIVSLVLVKVYKTSWPLVLALLTILIPLSTSVMESLNRYFLVLAPLLPLVIVLLSKKSKPVFLYAACAVSAVCMFALAFGFFDGRWFVG
jgi:hypothetical protein